MGRSSHSICEDCGTYQYNGYGSYGSWLDLGNKTLEEFDAEALKEPEYASRPKNKNVRHFLEKHQGHQIRYVTDDDDYCYYDGPRPLEGKTEEPAPYPFENGCWKLPPEERS